MKTTAIVRNVHVSARKAGLVCDLIRGKKVAEALVILENCHKKTAKILKKLLQSAIANATNNHSMDAKNLYIYGVVANQGRTIKRALPRAKGSSNMIRKRHSHLEIILSDDTKQRQIDLAQIKANVKKRAEGQHKSKQEKIAAKKVEVKKAPTKTSAAKKVEVKTTAAKKAPTKTPAAKKVEVKTTAAKKAPTKTTAKKGDK